MSQFESSMDFERWIVLGFRHFLSGPQLKASAIALEAFTKDFKSWDIQNYSIGVRETLDVFEVWLSPNLDPGTDFSDHIAYGLNKFGKEVHYTISKGRYEVIRVRFGN